MTPMTGATAPAAPASKVHPCSLRPIPASVLQQREVALESAFARAITDTHDQAEVVVKVRSGDASQTTQVQG